MTIWSPSKWWRERQERIMRYRLEREGRRQRNREAMPRTRIGRSTHDGMTESFVYYDFSVGSDCDGGGDSGSGGDGDGGGCGGD